MDSGDLALFNAAICITVYSGNRASFWHSCWIDGQAPAKLFPTLYGHSRKKHQTVREAVQGGNWIGHIAHELNDDILREYFQLWNAIESAQLNLDDNREDQIIWTLESSGEYSAKSAYNISSLLGRSSQILATSSGVRGRRQSVSFSFGS
jgi:hypothetical protein